MKLEEFELTFKSKFMVNVENYPKNWKRKQIIEAELDNFYNNPLDYLDLIITEDDYDITIE